MMYNTRRRLVRGVVHSLFAIIAIALLGACRMPFDWRLNVPNDWGMTSDPAGQTDGSLPGADDGDLPDPPPPSPPPTPGPEPVVVIADELTLTWDPPSEPVSGYLVYYRVHGDSQWTLLSTVLVLPEKTVTQAELDFGQYEFAVSSVGQNGAESELHSSLDNTAQPGTGWFLDWREA